MTTEQRSIFSEAVLALKHALNSSAWLVSDETNAPMRMASLIEIGTFRTSRYLKHKPRVQISHAVANGGPKKVAAAVPAVISWGMGVISARKPVPSGLGGCQSSTTAVEIAEAG
jgi:hypothetical protein